MPIDPRRFLEDTCDFTVASLQWCSTESETEVSRIHDSLQVLMSDVQRRSSMSKNALSAVADLQEKLSRGPGNQTEVKQLLDVLQRFSDDHVEVRELITPIIEALQFQDRLRQNLENLGKIIKVWVARRPAMLRTQGISDSEMVTLGSEFLKCTTSVEERDLIRTLIPDLPAEEVRTDTDMLF